LLWSFSKVYIDMLKYNMQLFSIKIKALFIKKNIWSIVSDNFQSYCFENCSVHTKEKPEADFKIALKIKLSITSIEIHTIGKHQIQPLMQCFSQEILFHMSQFETLSTFSNFICIYYMNNNYSFCDFLL
jgi:hypothetical protein